MQKYSQVQKPSFIQRLSSSHYAGTVCFQTTFFSKKAIQILYNWHVNSCVKWQGYSPLLSNYVISNIFITLLHTVIWANAEGGTHTQSYSLPLHIKNTLVCVLWVLFDISYMCMWCVERMKQLKWREIIHRYISLYMHAKLYAIKTFQS